MYFAANRKQKVHNAKLLNQIKSIIKLPQQITANGNAGNELDSAPLQSLF